MAPELILALAVPVVAIACVAAARWYVQHRAAARRARQRLYGSD